MHMESASFVLRKAIENKDFAELLSKNELVQIRNYLIRHFTPNKWAAESATAFFPYNIDSIINQCSAFNEFGIEINKSIKLLTRGLDDDYLNMSMFQPENGNFEFQNIVTIPNISDGFDQAELKIESCPIYGAFRHTHKSTRYEYRGLHELRKKDLEALPIKIASSPVAELFIDTEKVYHTEFPDRIFIRQVLTPNFPKDKIHNFQKQVTTPCACLLGILLNSNHLRKHKVEIYDKSLEGFSPHHPSIKTRPYRIEEIGAYGQTGWGLLGYMMGAYWIPMDKNECKKTGRDFKLRNKLNTALNYLVLALTNKDPLAKMIMSVSGIESLLGEKESVSDKIARRLSVLLSTTKEQRSESYKKYKSLYNNRSRLIHGDTHLVSASDVEEWFRVACYTVRYLLLWIDFMNKSLGPSTPDQKNAEFISHENFLNEIDSCSQNGQYMAAIHIK